MITIVGDLRALAPVLGGLWMCLGAIVPAAPAAEVRTLTLAQAAKLAFEQSPDAALARLDYQAAALRVREAGDPFVPKVFAGSGLAYSSGFPMSIEGAAPSVVQARAVASVFNRSLSLNREMKREEARGAALEQDQRREAVMARVIELYLEADYRGRLVEAARLQVELTDRLKDLKRVRVNEGRDLPLELRRAELEAARARQRIRKIEGDRDHAEAVLAWTLGLEDTRARPVGDREAPELPVSREEAVSLALDNNREVRRLESALAARGLAARAEHATRYPQLDLVAQYGLFAKFNNYEDFFRRFQRHNGQFGVSLQVPLSPSPGAEARRALAENEAARLRVEIGRLRGRIRIETEKQFETLAQAEAARQVSRLDLDVARESLTVRLARFEEGRASLAEVEQDRVIEQEKWLAYYESQHNWETARYALLAQVGRLLWLLR